MIEPVAEIPEIRTDAHAALPDREPELDGLRALAALMVALLHCFFAVGMPAGMRDRLLSGPLGAAVNGSSAVILFFVLSGYVLAGSFSRDPSPRATIGFFVRRILRIYPAWMVALALAWLATRVYPHLPRSAGLGSSIGRSLELSVGCAEIVRSAFVPGLAGGLVPPGWTLPIELVLSALLPLMFVIAARTRGAWLLALALAALVFGGDPAAFSFPFALGVLAYFQFGARVRDLRAPARSVLASAALVGFFLPPTALSPVSQALRIGVPSLAALVLLEFARSVPAWRRVLGSRALVRLGEVSFGFYLNHYTVLCLLAPFVLPDEAAGTVPSAIARWLLLSAIVAAIASGVAVASYQWIEKPSMAFGRRLAGDWRKRA